ncbi:hypothetical protein [Schlesneria sp.]|uniref:hypothetical protein n=1 Tax=Schlesneria sp. TaxID=2762018 RepID=UPI002EF5161A
MQPREKLILGILVGFVVVWQGSGWAYSVIFGPFQARSEQLERLTKSVAEKDDLLLNLARSAKTLKEARQISLPPDGGKLKRPDASNAERLYQRWLTDLGELCEMEDLKVSPARRALKGNEYVSVGIRLEAEARYEQIVRFLDLFYRTNLLHRISQLHISSPEVEGDPFMKVSLEAEGIALVDAPTRRTLFPQTNLTADTPEDATAIEVEVGDDFPKEPGFQIRIENEFMTVTEMEGGKWTVTRGVDQTSSSLHEEGSLVELVRQIPGLPQPTQEAFSQLVSANIFVKPAPPYKMQLAPITERPFVRGKAIELTLNAVSYDTSKGKPQFSLVGDPPANLRLDKSGRLTWRPSNDVKQDAYPLKIEIRHPSAPQGVLTETVTIRLRDANPIPKLADTNPPVVYLNRDWKFQPELVNNPDSTARYTWKLGKSIEGLSINDRTGELTWAPGDAIPTGELTVPLVVTDNDSPPQSTTLALKLDVQDDEAFFTRLNMIFRQGDVKRAFFYDASRNKTTELHEGDEFSVAELQGTVKEINRNHIILKIGKKELRLNSGQTLREAQSPVVRR